MFFLHNKQQNCKKNCTLVQLCVLKISKQIVQIFKKQHAETGQKIKEVKKTPSKPPKISAGYNLQTVSECQAMKATNSAFNICFINTKSNV